VDAVGFREATAEDAAALGRLHVASWRESYAGLLPGDLLAGLSAEARAAMWSAVLGDPAAFNETAVFVAERGDEMVGFAACGGQRDEGLQADGFTGEFGAIYVLGSHQRHGVGGSLMRLMSRRLLDHGRTAAALWVLRENVPARAFYERIGGALVGERRLDEYGTPLTEVAYGWRDLAALAGE
jgi:ribosomal protein S18 acetylase RimI-like enzyme